MRWRNSIYGLVIRTSGPIRLTRFASTAFCLEVFYYIGFALNKYFTFVIDYCWQDLNIDSRFGT